jgi:Chaperonin GroEL (HSP60 family)
MINAPADKFTTKEETQNLVKDTVDNVFEVVCSTLGPDGQVVVIQEGTAVKTTKDGATVARSLEFKNLHQDKINQIMAEAARKTEMECGDGTTTTIFLTKHYYDLFRKHPGFINRTQIEKVTSLLIQNLEGRAVFPKIGSQELRAVATITANQDQSIVDTVLGIFDKYEAPVFDLQEGNSHEDKISKSKGLRMRMSLSDPAFTKHGNGQQTTFDNLHFAVVNQGFGGSHLNTDLIVDVAKDLDQRYPGAKIGLVVTQASTSFCSLVLGLNKMLREHGNSTEFVVFSTNISGTLGGLIMGDMGAVLNASTVSALEDLKNTDLRLCPETVVANLNYSLMETLGEETRARVDDRVAEIQRTLDEMNSSARFSPLGSSAEKRIQQLKGQVVTVYVGGETYSDIKERKDRFEDVGLAVKSALANGILPGCGIALREAGYEVYKSEDVKGIKQEILDDILRVCYAQWVYLSGFDLGDATWDVNTLLHVPDEEGRRIMNLATGEEGTPEELGVYDTAYASITALKGGMTTAKILANTSSIIMGNRAGAITLGG